MKLKIKNLLAEWVCMDIRPFSIVNDDGLKSIIQECILLGVSHRLRKIVVFVFLFSFYFRIIILARRGGGESGAGGARRGRVEDFKTRRGGGEMNFWLTRGSLKRRP